MRRRLKKSNRAASVCQVLFGMRSRGLFPKRTMKLGACLASAVCAWTIKSNIRFNAESTKLSSQAIDTLLRQHNLAQLVRLIRRNINPAFDRATPFHQL